MTRDAEHTPSPQSVVTLERAEYERLIGVAEDLISNTQDPGTEALAAVYCARRILAAPAPSSLAGGEKHYGDPCIRCGVGHDNVPPGPCQGDGITISRERARAVLDYLKNGRGPAGWPTQLWVEVQHFIANIEAALSTEAPARDGVALDVLRDLVAAVRGECPSILNEDSGGNAALCMRIDDVLDAAALTPRHEAPAPEGGAS